METTVRQSGGNVKMVQDVTRLLGYVQTDEEITGLYLIAQVVCYCWFIITNICTRKFLNWHINPELHSNWLRQMQIPNNDIIILCRKEYQNWLQIGKLIWFTLIDLLDCEPYKYGPNCAFDCGHCKHDKPCLWILGTVLVGVWMGGQANTALQVSDVIITVVHTFPIFSQNDLQSNFRFTFVKWSPTLTNKKNQKVSHNNNTSNTWFFFQTILF